MQAGFIPALGTPVDARGHFLEDSFRKHLEDQVQAGAAALLAMGSMGQQPYLLTGECKRVAQAAVEQAAERLPVFLGAMDTSLARVRERIAAMEQLDIAGFVLTTPYYYPLPPRHVIRFYQQVAASTRHRIFLYDLPVVTQTKITLEMVLELIGSVPNLGGIKSNDMQMFRQLKLNPQLPADFLMAYSGLDTFDVFYKWGIRHCLDGMMDCTPRNSRTLFGALAAGDDATASAALNNILSLRNLLAANDIWPSFTVAMNLLGFEGLWAPDYVPPIGEAAAEAVRRELERIGEL